MIRRREDQKVPVELLGYEWQKPGCHGVFGQLKASPVEQGGPGFCGGEGHEYQKKIGERT